MLIAVRSHTSSPVNALDIVNNGYTGDYSKLLQIQLPFSASTVNCRTVVLESGTDRQWLIEVVVAKDQ